MRMVAAKIANFCRREGLQSVFKGLKSIISNCNGALTPLELRLPTCTMKRSEWTLICDFVIKYDDFPTFFHARFSAKKTIAQSMYALIVAPKNQVGLAVSIQRLCG